MKRNNLTRKIVRLALFLAIGIVLNIVESVIILPYMMPGVRLGLANTMGLIVLYFYSPKDYLILGVLRVVLVGLLYSGIGSVAFLISLSGWFLSSSITLLVYLFKKASIYGLSITSAMFHGVGQIIMVMILYSMPSMINYLPILLVTGLVSGPLTAFLGSIVLARMDRILV